MSDMPRTGAFSRSMNFVASNDPTRPRFHMEAVQDEAASAREGRPIFRQEERIQFLIPGSPNSPVFRVTDEHRERWPDFYAAFKRGEEMAMEGTPLEQWPVLARNQVLELKALQIFTVEQCASLSDTAIQKIGLGGRAIRERAQAYLDDAAAIALTERLNRENEEKTAHIASLQRQVEELSALVHKLHDMQVRVGDMPHPIATHIPASVDPYEQAKVGVMPHSEARSSLDSLTAPVRRRGRPSNAEVAARQAQEGNALNG